MDCIERIEQLHDELSASERKLADFIVANAALIRDYSSQLLARAAGVSQSSVVKFSQKLGYRGFTDLKLAVSESVLRQYYSEQSAGSANGDRRVPAARAASQPATERRAVPRTPDREANNPMERIRRGLEALSSNERRLAEYVLANAALIRDYSSQQIAAATGCSQSSVVKFSQKLGYRGFTDLKLAVHEAAVLHRLSSAPPADQRREDDRQLFDALCRSKAQAVQRTVKINDAGVVSRAVAAIAAAGAVLLVTGDGSRAAAEDLAVKLRLLELDVRIDARPDAAAEALQRELEVVVLYLDETSPESLARLLCAPARGKAPIAISDYNARRQAAGAELVLHFLSRDGDPRLDAAVRTASLLQLNDMLYVALAQTLS